MSVMLEFAIYPVGKGESLSDYVAQSEKIIHDSGVKYKFGPMSTILEGEWNEVIGVVEECYENMKKICHRVVCNISIDYREGRKDGLTGKVKSVQKKLPGIKLRT